MSGLVFPILCCNCINRMCPWLALLLQCHLSCIDIFCFTVTSVRYGKLQQTSYPLFLFPCCCCCCAIQYISSSSTTFLSSTVPSKMSNMTISWCMIPSFILIFMYSRLPQLKFPEIKLQPSSISAIALHFVSSAVLTGDFGCLHQPTACQGVGEREYNYCLVHFRYTITLILLSAIISLILT